MTTLSNYQLEGIKPSMNNEKIQTKELLTNFRREDQTSYQYVEFKTNDSL